MTFADRVNAFNKNLEFKGHLPDGIRVMNPFRESPGALEISSAFYKKFYDDRRKRRVILGINPGRFGAGATGVPFTDTKRLESKCGLKIEGLQTHEPSSVFVYELIDAYGGVEAFYGDFYITSICPLGFVKVNDKGREVNYNYYDSRALTEAARPFMEWSLRTQTGFGVHADVCFVLGTGKNFRFIGQLNSELKVFGKLIPLEHPRFIMQYRSREKDDYVKRFVRLLSGA